MSDAQAEHISKLNKIAYPLARIKPTGSTLQPPSLKSRLLGSNDHSNLSISQHSNLSYKSDQPASSPSHNLDDSCDKRLPFQKEGFSLTSSFNFSLGSGQNLTKEIKKDEPKRQKFQEFPRSISPNKQKDHIAGAKKNEKNKRKIVTSGKVPKKTRKLEEEETKSRASKRAPDHFIKKINVPEGRVARNLMSDFKKKQGIALIPNQQTGREEDSEEQKSQSSQVKEKEVHKRRDLNKSHSMKYSFVSASNSLDDYSNSELEKNIASENISRNNSRSNSIDPDEDILGSLEPIKSEDPGLGGSGVFPRQRLDRSNSDLNQANYKAFGHSSFNPEDSPEEEKKVLGNNKFLKEANPNFFGETLDAPKLPEKKDDLEAKWHSKRIGLSFQKGARKKLISCFEELDEDNSILPSSSSSPKKRKSGDLIHQTPNFNCFSLCLNQSKQEAILPNVPLFSFQNESPKSGNWGGSKKNSFMQKGEDPDFENFSIQPKKAFGFSLAGSATDNFEPEENKSANLSIKGQSDSEDQNKSNGSIVLLKGGKPKRKIPNIEFKKDEISREKKPSIFDGLKGLGLGFGLSNEKEKPKESWMLQMSLGNGDMNNLFTFSKPKTSKGNEVSSQSHSVSEWSLDENEKEPEKTQVISIGVSLNEKRQKGESQDFSGLGEFNLGDEEEAEECSSFNAFEDMGKEKFESSEGSKSPRIKNWEEKSPNLSENSDFQAPDSSSSETSNENEESPKTRFETDFKILGLIHKSSSKNCIYKCQNKIDGLIYSVRVLDLDKMTSSPNCEAKNEDSERIGKNRSPTFMGIDLDVKTTFKFNRSPSVNSGTEKPKRASKGNTLILHEDFSSFRELGMHPHILKYYDTWNEDSNLFIVSDFCQKSIQSLKYKPNERNLRDLIEQIISALAFLHKNKLQNIGLTKSNILLSHDQKYKLDICSSRILPKNHLPKWDTSNQAYKLDDIHFKNGENLRGRKDILALGLVLAEVLLGSEKWVLPVDWDVVKGIKAKIRTLNKYSNSLRSMVISMLDENPKARPSARKILKNYLSSKEDFELQTQKALILKLQKKKEGLLEDLRAQRKKSF